MKANKKRKKLFTQRRILTEDEVQELRVRYKKYCDEVGEDATIGEFKIK